VRLLPTTVVSGVTGEAVGAQVATCCGQPGFSVFQIDGQNHPHMQCLVCATSYCTTGDCKQERAPAARDRRECPSCGRLLSDREATEQGVCNDCSAGGRARD
jgi:hypothetical protein